MDNHETSQEDKLFVLQMTKLQFEKELSSFVKGSTPPVLIAWHVLRRRRGERERKQLTGMDLEDIEWDKISNITEADSIKLIRDPYRGITLEIQEKEVGLWIVISSEGDKEPDDVLTKEGWLHLGFKQIKVNPEAYNDLRRWLESKQSAYPNHTTYVIGENHMGDNFDFRNSNITNNGGQMLLGKIQNVTASLNASGKQEIGNALTNVKNEIEKSDKLSETQRQEVLELVSQIGEEAAKAKPNKTILQALGDGLLIALKAVPDLIKVAGVLLALLPK